MTGSDLSAAAAKISAASGLPAAYADIHGDRDYLYGISTALETMARLLTQASRERIPRLVNLLGCNKIDWSEETLVSSERWLANAGWRVLSKWSGRLSLDEIRQASSAQVNLVVNEAGLRLARYTKTEYGIPYVTGAPSAARSATGS